MVTVAIWDQPKQRVIIGIRNLGRIQRVIGAVGLSQRLRQPGKLIPGLSLGQLFNIANRANYNVPSNNITAATFGQSTSLLPLGGVASS